MRALGLFAFNQELNPLDVSWRLEELNRTEFHQMNKIYRQDTKAQRKHQDKGEVLKSPLRMVFVSSLSLRALVVTHS